LLHLINRLYSPYEPHAPTLKPFKPRFQTTPPFAKSYLAQN